MHLMFSTRYGTSFHHTVWYGCPKFTVARIMREEITRLLECILEERVKRRANLVLQPTLSFHDMLLHNNKNKQNFLYI
jgi:hypothetical protein